MPQRKLLGPFAQALTLADLPLKGPLSDETNGCIENAGILLDGETIAAVGRYLDLKGSAPVTEKIESPMVVIPGLVDCHTHLCWAGSRAGDYAMRLSGKTYLEIARQGGGIWSTVTKTREAGEDDLAGLAAMRADVLLHQGVTTVEVKSGYGLNTALEIKMLQAIRQADRVCAADLISTCLALHIKPRDFEGGSREYLDHVLKELLPVVLNLGLSRRVDVYVDEGAFTPEEARYYLKRAQEIGFACTVHADQFTRGGVQVAAELGAWSADHLEASVDKDFKVLADSGTVAVVLPGASMGLGIPFASARKILEAGACLAMASDWNPGSAPMGRLLMQASVLGAYEKLTMTETLAAITYRAAHALRLPDRGVLKAGMLGDLIAFPCTDYREIVYYQGGLEPVKVWKRGVQV